MAGTPLVPVMVRAHCGLTTPLGPQIQNGAARFALIRYDMASVSGRGWYANGAGGESFKDWLRTVWGMNAWEDDHNTWERVCIRDLPSLATSFPKLNWDSRCSLLVLRDAVGWILLDTQNPEEERRPERATAACFPEAKPLVGDAPFWPLAWIRPHVSAHDHLARRKRVLEDFAVVRSVNTHPVPQPLFAA